MEPVVLLVKFRQILGHYLLTDHDDRQEHQLEKGLTYPLNENIEAV